MARSTSYLMYIILFGCFMLFLNLSLTPTHDQLATTRHSQLSLRSKIHEKFPSMEYLSGLRDNTEDAIKRLDDQLWTSALNINVTFLPDLLPVTQSVSLLDYNATALYFSEHLRDFKNNTKSLMESTESKLKQLLLSTRPSTLNTSDLAPSSGLFLDPIHYDYEQLFTASQMEQLFNNTRDYFHQTRNKLNQYITAVSSSSSSVVARGDTVDDPDPAGQGRAAALPHEAAADPTTPLATSASASSGGLSLLQNLFAQFRHLSPPPLASAAAVVNSTKRGEGEGATPVPKTIMGGACVASFEPTCEMKHYVRFWKKQFNEHDCHKSPLLKLRPADSSSRRSKRSKGGHDQNSSTSPSSLLLERYVVFQPDGGGWNNIRMAAETAMVFALASGRTLVLPPDMQFYLLNKNGDAKRDTSSFETYFDLRKISELVTIITMPQFLKEFEQLSDKNILPKKETPQTLGGKNRGKLWSYLEQTCYTRDYHPGRMFFGFNISHDLSEHQDHDSDQDPDPAVARSGASTGSAGSSGGVHFGPIERDGRRKRMAAHDRELVPYDAHLDSLRCVYFPGDYREKYRLLTHFYSYLYWAQPAEERRYKRLVRDRLHYRDDIFCAAGDVVHLILSDSYLLGSPSRPLEATEATEDGDGPGAAPRGGGRCSGFRITNHIDPRTLSASATADDAAGGGRSRARSRSLTFETCHSRATLGGDTRWDGAPTFFAMHIRRGDFQYGHTRRSAAEIWDNVKHLLDANITRLLYISTDEKNTSFFDPFREVFTVKFLRDYAHTARLLPSQGGAGAGGGFNQNYVGMVEQVVCASAHTFIGTPLSTFTGYITRMRGYHRDGRYAHTFYFLPSPMHQLHTQPELKGPFWAREFAVAHRDVDDDVDTG